MSPRAGRIATAIGEAVSGLRTSDREPDRISYARDLWPRHHLAVRDGRVAEHKPGAVVWPETPEQVAEVVAWCTREGVPIVPYGAGSGVCGGVLPTEETVVVDVKRMRRWRRFEPEAGILEVEAGAVGIRLEEELQAKGYTVGHFPSSILCSTIGGWVAARGAGQCSGLYGKIEDMVAELEVVDGRGEIARLRRRVNGPDLLPLIIGSEGVLGVITSATFRLHDNPTHRAYLGLSFSTMQAGSDAIRQIYQSGLRPAVCRLYDPFDSMMARRSAKKREGQTGDGKRSGKKRGRSWLKRVVPGLGATAIRNLLRVPGAINATIEALGDRAFGGAMLVLIFEGERSRTVPHKERAADIARRLGAEDLGEGPARHWIKHRYSVSYRQAPMFMTGAFVDTMEVAAPWSRLDALYDGVREALGSHVMVMAHMSHAYPDGCSIYFTFAGSAENDRACERRYDEAWRAAQHAAIEAGGTLSHHHGVGRSKAPMMGAELGAGIDIVSELRRALDPSGIFNPGNLMPTKSPPRPPLLPPPTEVQVSERDQLVHASADHTLAMVQKAAESHGLELALDGDTRPDTRVSAWLAAGAPGCANPWHDPVDHLVAGYSATLASGVPLTIRPCPRRAVGPDLYALFHGMHGRVGELHTAHLRVGPTTAHALQTPIDPNPGIDATEKSWIDRLTSAAAATR